MRIAIIGSRSIGENDLEYVFERISSHVDKKRHDIIISGGAKGVDSLAEKFAERYGIGIKIIKPDYKKYPASMAPHIRNGEIVEAAKVIICFWDGISSGTKSVIDLAKKKNKEMYIYCIPKKRKANIDLGYSNKTLTMFKDINK